MGENRVKHLNFCLDAKDLRHKPGIFRQHRDQRSVAMVCMRECVVSLCAHVCLQGMSSHTGECGADD